MGKRVYFLKFNKKILMMDLSSVYSGIIGTTLGILSILALEPFWNDNKASILITIIAIVFDTLSFSLTFTPFFLMFRLINMKKEMIKQNMTLYRKDLISIWCDFSSFFVGLIGTVCEIISVISLIPPWDNPSFSYQITIVGVVLDIISTSIAVATSLLTINIIKNYRLRGNSII